MMRLGETPDPVTQDVRNQILRDIQYGRDLKAKADGRVAIIPIGRTTPFSEDQARFEAAGTAYAQTEAGVRALENRLTSTSGPYWMDLTQAEKDNLALWLEAAKELDAVTYRHYPTSVETDVKKVVLLVIGVGAIFSPLIFSKSADVGLPFMPQGALPFDVAPRGHQRPLREEGAPLLTRSVQPTLPAPVYSAPSVETGRMTEPIQATASVVTRSGFNPPPRFSKGFGPAGSPARTGASTGIPVNVMRRSDGQQRFIYPKPRSS
jgi:hypothetical protein